MGDEHLSTIPEMESDELIKSSVENLVPNLSESEDLSKDNIKSECNVPVCDDFTTFSNPLFDAHNNFSSSDDKSSFEEDVSKENFKFFSNRLSDEEIISTKIDPHHFNTESVLIESLLNQDTLIISSPKYDSLLEEFSGEFAHIDLIPPGINEADFDHEEDIHLVERLFNDSPSLPKNKSFHFDFPSFLCPPAKPPDDGIYFEPDTGLLTAKVVGDICKHYVLMPRLLPTQPTICPLIDTLLLFSSENEDKVHLLSHQGFKASQLIFDFSESPMMIYGRNIPILEVPFLHFYPYRPAQVWGIDSGLRLG
uniref:Reverse transcriptase domain-containing protein n=1 Tax=Tanacetum cinerariifolium TaxID=118510 RepID=A0A6L2M6Y2_TANCI|nr:hypothetical protein [Tanacetum cinerariifolium]